MFRQWLRSLSGRLWLTSIAALAVSLAVLAAMVLYSSHAFPQQTLGRRELLEGARHVANGLAFEEGGRPVSVRLPEQVEWLFEMAPADLKYRVTDARGEVLLASGDARERDAWLQEPLAAAAGQVESAALAGKPFYVTTLRVTHADSIYYVQTATSERLNTVIIEQKIKHIPGIVRITFLVATIIFGFTLTFTVHRVLEPLRQVSHAAALITPRNLAARLPAANIPNEIKPLINAFNAALARLENGFSVQQQFLASAAHELQTPLTLIRGQIELQPEIEGKEQLFREIDLMARQVRQLLHLAEVSESQNFNFSEVGGVDVAQDVLEYLERKAGQKQVKLQLHASLEPPPILADRSALFILLKNLVENAINVSPPDSVVALRVERHSIQVQDQGPGIKDEYLPFLFKRFWRAPDARHDGAGLGLAICREIALAHEWRLTVKSALPGTRFEVWFQAPE